MNQNEYDQLQGNTPARARALHGADLVDQTPRTLLYGYTVDRYTFHVYLDEKGVIHKLVYAGSASPMLIVHSKESDLESNDAYVPNKRVYPEACDFEFCQLLYAHGVNLPFTTFNPERDLSKAFHGNRLEELHQPGESLPLR